MNFDYPVIVDGLKLMAIMCRIGAFLLALPFVSQPSVPRRYRVAIILMISIVLMPAVPPAWSTYAFATQLDLGRLVIIMGSEILLGLAISLSILLFLEIFGLAGAIIDRDIGLSMATQFDPTLEDTREISAHLYIQIFLLLFLIVDGHHDFIRLAALSFQTLPPASFLIQEGSINLMILLGEQMLVLGSQLAFPIMGVMLLINIALGLMARVGEDFPVLMLSFAIKLGVGMLMMISILPIFIQIGRESIENLFQALSILVAAD